MKSLGLTSKDFEQLKPEQFEELVYQLLEAMRYQILERPARGPDGGRDILVERVVKDAMIKERERVVVQCKHKAHNEAAVKDADVGVFQMAMTRFSARGYLLVTNTKFTENVNRAFREFNKTDSPKWAAIWNVYDLIKFLNENIMVRDTFFPTGVKHALVGEKITTSPFGFETLLKETMDRIFIAGQNLYHLTKKENKGRYKKLVLGALQEGKKVQIMLCDPATEYSVRTWQGVVGIRYKKHLDESINTFQEWLKLAKASKLIGLEIRKTVLVPLSIVFVDQDKEHAKLVFTPVVYEPRSDLRPCFSILRKYHSYVFDYYLRAYTKVFCDNKRTKPISGG